MKIKTTPLFKARRLAAYTSKMLPELETKGKQQILARWRLFQSQKMEREIYSSCIVLKNLAMVHKDLPMSADFILEQLMECSGALQNTYADILSAYRLGQGEEAFRILTEQVPLKLAANFAAVLSKIDKINPAELIVHMTAFEEALMGERMTKGMSKAERKSLVTTMAATATIFSILLNFTIVVVFMNTLQMIDQMFY